VPPDIASHPFFAKVDWQRLCRGQAPPPWSPEEHGGGAAHGGPDEDKAGGADAISLEFVDEEFAQVRARRVAVEVGVEGLSRGVHAGPVLLTRRAWLLLSPVQVLPAELSVLGLHLRDDGDQGGADEL
jgi:hypothetical protein